MVCGQNILIHAGQAGCQAGMACWELFCMEHGIYPDGTLATEFGYERVERELRPYFSESMDSKYSPRALFFDFDPTVIHDIKNGPYTRLFSHNNLIAGREDACNSYARGFYSMGVEYIERVMDRIRILTEASDSVDSYMIMRSNCGGTGSGFGSLILSKLQQDYGKKVLMTYDFNPSARLSTAPVEAYNCVLTCPTAIEHSDCSFCCENEKIYDMYERFLDVKCTNYQQVNQVIAQVLSGLTASFRFGGTLNADAADMQTNLVSYPRIHFPLVGYGPFVPYDRYHGDQHSTLALVRQAFEPKNQMLFCNPRKGKYMAAVLLFRGEVSLTDAECALMKMQQKSQYNRFQFVDWSPTGIKIGLNNSSPMTVPGSSFGCGCRSLVAIMNNTCIETVWQRILKKFDMMFKKKAFVHWYTSEGVEESELIHARENLEGLVVDFHEVGLNYDKYGYPLNSTYTGHEKVDLHIVH